jgi:hypothetical protein
MKRRRNRIVGRSGRHGTISLIPPAAVRAACLEDSLVEG